MKQYPQKHIMVDGVAYDIDTGEAIEQSGYQTNKHNTPNHPDVLDLRSPESIVKPSVAAIDKRQAKLNTTYQPPDLTTTELKPVQTKTSIVVEAKKRLSKTHDSIKKHYKKITPKTVTHKSHQSAVFSKPAELDYGKFVLLKGLWPPRLLVIWQMSLLRTVVSPQTWLLLSLPVILLQVRVLRNVTTNEALQKAKNYLNPDNYSAIVISFGLALSLFLVGLIFRSIISNVGIALRLRQIDKRKLQLSSAIRSAINSMLRQAINYLIHLFVIGLFTIFTIWIGISIWNSGNVFVSGSKYQLIVFIVILWALMLILLYSKHWLQVGLLARSSQSRHLQSQSFALIVQNPLHNFITGFLALVGIFIGYFSIIFIDWQVTEFFISYNGAPVVLVIIGVAIYTVLVLTTIQYFQQNLWARQYYFVASQATNSDVLLYMEREKPASLKPLYIIIASAVIIVMFYIILVTWQAPQIRGYLANLHAEVPAQIHFTLPVNK